MACRRPAPTSSSSPRTQHTESPRSPWSPAGDHGERGDSVCWVRGDDDDVGAGLRQAMRLLRGVPDALARRGYEVIT